MEAAVRERHPKRRSQSSSCSFLDSGRPLFMCSRTTIRAKATEMATLYERPVIIYSPVSILEYQQARYQHCAANNRRAVIREDAGQIVWLCDVACSKFCGGGVSPYLDRKLRNLSCWRGHIPAIGDDLRQRYPTHSAQRGWKALRAHVM